MEFVSQHCPDEGDQIDILVAVQEALANAALHGCRDDAAKTIQCVVRRVRSEITISVRDPGPGFRPWNWPIPTITSDERCRTDGAFA